MDTISHPITPSYFYDNYMIKNKPCIIQYDILSSWRCMSDWKTSDDQINFEFLDKNLGHLSVPVSNCKQKYYNSQVSRCMNFRDYIRYFGNLIESGHNYSTNECLYLKDWHFVLEVPEYEAYETPKIFSNDWLNEYCLSKGESDYRFVYMGPKGSSTPLHKDVFSSFSWSANIVGQKEWILIPPGKEAELLMPDGQLPSDIKPKLNSPGFKDFFEVIEVVQDAGQVIFVPSGWIHQVLNTKDTISINHNWFNACNINFIYSSLTEASKNVREELKDIKPQENSSNWERECENLLRLHHGMHTSIFCDILEVVVGRLKNELSDRKPEEFFRVKHEIMTLMSFLQANQVCDELKIRVHNLLAQIDAS